ncbi:hypothetical protein BST97_02430 [Nonlabens spongiae]|uniref:Pentapeptide repeat-containing protein n=1 Tax=Nonlabens spongiae TaxID=331648 RepID=A0A1W6MHG2_9FLAO|nr:pentapeptide repeat-containing protein [Nonlabens spongiae]ARN76946.1 hypothetical protein BST97_02430 [Nonlabens spongiae]
MAGTNRKILTYEEFNKHFGLAGEYVNTSLLKSENIIRNRIINQPVIIKPGTPEVHFENCEFNCKVKICEGSINEFIPSYRQMELIVEEEKRKELSEYDFEKWKTDNELKEAIRSKKTNTIKHQLSFTNNCVFNMAFIANDMIFEKKFIVHSCRLNEFHLRNTKFHGLADFWNSTFNKGMTFYKTDFNKTAVFSMATFEENVLFTYSLLAGKSIFAKTEFKAGLDLSQAIISGELKIFDLLFRKEEFDTNYFEKENKNGYQKAIDYQGIIPTENKVHTFQILRKALEDVGNYDDATKMRRAEKSAARQLNYESLELGEIPVMENQGDNNLLLNWATEPFRSFRLINWKELRSNDGLILFLNRRSNKYKTSFWTGVWFTVRMALLFALVTLLSLGDFWAHLPWIDRTTPDYEAMQKGVKFIVQFFNPARRINYLDALNPWFGLAYIFDFLGRIAVGYGIYQTVQAFRKFK